MSWETMYGDDTGRSGGEERIRFIESAEELDEALSQPAALLFKHSTRCGTSRRALEEVQRYARGEDAVATYGIDVIRHRGLSLEAAERLGIRHESPQAILLRGGAPAWHASHHRISADALRAAAGAELTE